MLKVTVTCVKHAIYASAVIILCVLMVHFNNDVIGSGKITSFATIA